ncbi:AAA family ATPase [Aeromonas veronii]
MNPLQQQISQLIEQVGHSVVGQSHVISALVIGLLTNSHVLLEGLPGTAKTRSVKALAEAQMDRFALKVSVSYPDDEAELAIIRLVRAEERGTRQQNEGFAPLSPELILQARSELSAMTVSPLVEHYIIALVMATRHPNRYPATGLPQWIAVGASPRASIALDKCARAYAWLQGRNHVLPDDVRAMVPSVLGHRFTLSYDALADGVDHQQVVMTLLDHVVIG